MHELIEVKDRVNKVKKARKRIIHVVLFKMHANNSATNEKPKIKTQVRTYYSLADLPPLEELNPKRNTIVMEVIDDRMMQDLTNVKGYFCRA